jgi:peptidoglycan/LPS O-acetylase OafA/YrhL
MGERLISLDALRGIVALTVAIPHFFLYAGSGSEAYEIVSVIAVEVFFVLSGFVLAPQILLVADSKSIITLRTFLIRRWMRTIPPYIVALVIVSVLVSSTNAPDFLRYLSYTQNLFRQHNVHDYYPVAWSLSIEEWFYLLFPALVLSVLPVIPAINRQNAIMLLTIGFLIAIAVVRLAWGHGSDWGADVRRVVVFRVDSVAFGFLLYLLWKRIAARSFLDSAFATVISVAMVLLLAGALDVTLVEIKSTLAQSLFPYLAAMFGAMCVVTSIMLERRLSGHLPRTISVLLGRLSYPVYLFHLLAIYIATTLFGAGMAAFALFLAATAFFAGVSFFFVEQPILEARPKYRETSLQNPSFSISAVAS